MRSLGAVGSTIHSMIKFSTNRGVVTMETSKEALWECRQLEKMQNSWKETQWRQDMEQMSKIWEQAILQTRSNLGQRSGKEPIFPRMGEHAVNWPQTAASKRPPEEYGRIYMGRIRRNSRATVFHGASAESVPFGRVGDPQETTINNLSKASVKGKSADGLFKPQQNLCQRYVPLSRSGRGISIFDGISVQMLPTTPLIENSQIRMVEGDEEKTGFHTEEGVYCFTHMLRGLKNSAATLQRMIEKVLADQKGQNVEVYLEEIVVKGRNERSLIQDVEETLGKLQRVNIKTNSDKCSFRMEECKFLGYVVANEGIGADPEKTNEAEEALQKIKRTLNKLQVLVMPKEGELLMICLQQGSETISYALFVERGGVQEMLKISGINGRLAKWAAELRMYDVSYILSKEAEGQVEGNRVPRTKETKKIQGRSHGCNGFIPQVSDHTSPQTLEPQSISTHRACNYKVEVPKSRGIGGCQDKTISESGRQQQRKGHNRKGGSKEPNFIWENSGSN
uniref:Reverse transcriptase domain-containing protein n=1 Tax=Tanacetum cinerariifolium TaxID=118510 RepID=A0A6L2J0J3_TANCI|nr:hypothetical protein [Tanacetum cinerariifolium]